ncbi:MAG: FtsX-like permease family protein [Lachnospiraceae bacterium]
MNIVHKLTLRHLKANKGRSVVTTLGIMISVAMITAVFVALASFMQLTADIDIQECGDKVAAIYNVTPKQLKTLRQDDRVEVGAAVDNALSFQLAEGGTTVQRTSSLYVSDPDNDKLMILGDYSGNLPIKPDEIAVESDLIETNHLDWKIGDTVTIPTGHRQQKDDEGEVFDADGVFYSPNETFSYVEDRTYTITAILHHNVPTYSCYQIIAGMDTANTQGMTANIKLKKLGMDSYKVLEEIVGKAGFSIDECDINKSLMASHLAFGAGSQYGSLSLLIGIILFLIIVASISLIYNAFAMSLSERVRYLGMLASVGATKKQKRGSIYYEGFILGLIGIPLGILSGIIGIAVTLHIIGGKIISSGMLTNASNYYGLSMRTVVPVWAIIGILIFSVLTIFISAFIPARKASRITPIDAIRQREEIAVKARSLRVPRIIRLIFGYEGELAYKNQKRNGRKGRVIIASMILSLALFLSVQYFCDLLTTSVSFDNSIPYQIQMTTPYANKDELRNIVQQSKGVKAFYSDSFEYVEISNDSNDTTMKELVQTNNLTEEGSRKIEGKSAVPVYVYHLDDDDFNALCGKNGLNAADYYGDSDKFLLMRQLRDDKTGEVAFADSIVGQSLDSYRELQALREDDEATLVPAGIGGLIDYDADNSICRMAPRGIVLYIPQSTYVKNLSADRKDDEFYRLAIETDTHEETYQDICERLAQSEISASTGGYDISSQQETMAAIGFIMKVFLYGFIVLITLIIMANIINTVSTGIALRRKEFAMLKSVGMTRKGFNKMIALESILYGIKSSIIGIPLAVLLSYWMFRTSASATAKFTLNVPMYLFALAVLFALLVITMVYSVRKLKDDSIVETLKSEIS